MNTPPRKESETGLYAPVWRKINQLIDYLREVQVAHGRNVRVTRTLNGTLLLGENKSKPAEPSPPVKRYRIKSVENDTIVANEVIGGTVLTTDTVIAKPFNLRRTGWHGQEVIYSAPAYPGNPGTVTISYNYVTPVYRVATIVTFLGTTTEHQVITPYYLAGSEIVVARPENGTGVEDTELLDINGDGRAWARAV